MRDIGENTDGSGRGVVSGETTLERAESHLMLALEAETDRERTYHIRSSLQSIVIAADASEE
jgi:hypothetical protein